MPIYYTTTNSTSYPQTGYYWSTSTTTTTTDCSGFTYKRYKEDEKEYLKHWLENWNKSLKEPEISDDDILTLIEGDD